ncbi:MAG: glycosyltransferase family 39 protein [Bryobacteraceae bacterium]
MLPAESRPKVVLGLAVLLCGAFLLQSFAASRVKSAGADEPPHFAAGLSYVSTGKVVLNPQHPPLLKELSGLFTLFSGARWPHTQAAQLALAGQRPMDWIAGREILRANGPDNALFWARMPMTLVAALGAALLFLWGRAMFGAVAGLAAMFLYALDPVIVGHSFSITFDVGVAVFSVLFLFVLWRYVQNPSVPRLVWCGVALGAALGAKFSAMFLLPVAGVLLFAAARARRIKAGPNDPCPCGSGKKFRKCHGAEGATSGGGMLRAAWVFGAMLLGAALTLQVIYLFSGDPLIYWKNFNQVYADENPNHLSFLAGQFQKRFWGYFPAAYLLKEPLASIACVAIGLVILVRSKSIKLLDKLFVVVPAFGYFGAHMVVAANIGIRYIFPALPFAYLIGGVGLASLLGGSRRMKIAAAVLALWMVAAAAGSFPNGLSYFNESACLLTSPGEIGLGGGSRCGIKWLDDSNVDWGQGLKQLRAWMEEHARGRQVYLANPLGGLTADAYGLNYADMQGSAAPPPGLYAVSAHLVARYPKTWVQRIPPTAIVGQCLYVYDIR